jgi:hypothetical protein
MKRPNPVPACAVFAIALITAACSISGEPWATVKGRVPYLGLGENPQATRYYVAPSGSDESGSGSESAPWRTVAFAESQMAAGDTLVFHGGIYEVEDEGLTLAVSGAGPDAKTTYRARRAGDSYERVIVTGAMVEGRHRPPKVRVKGDYIRVEGLWFGGDWKTADGSAPDGNEFHAYGGGRLDSVREIVNCTFFGFNGVRVGALEYSYWHGNRFVHCGTGTPLGDPPMLYFSGDHGDGMQAQHAIVDANTFVVGRGYAINGWHSWRNFIVTRNFIAGSWGGYIADGVDAEAQGPKGQGREHLVANNIFWNNTGTNAHNGATLIAHATHFVNNVLAGNIIGVAYDEATESYGGHLEDFQVLDNAFYDVWLGYFASDPDASRYVLLDVETDYQTRKRDDYVATLTPGTFNRTEAQVDAAVAAIDVAFSKPVSTLYADSTVEPAFAVIAGLTAPEGSPLHDAGTCWFSNTTTNIGTDIDAPDTPNAFWDAFTARKLRHFNADGDLLLVD